MEKKRSTGIVLQTRFPVKRVVIVLDSALGKIEVVPAKSTLENMVRGFLVSYQLEEWRSLWIAHATEIAAIPAEWIKQDIIFMHQLLEVCLVYSPFNQAAPLLFEILNLIYSDLTIIQETCIRENWRKKILLCKLLALLGLYPDASVVSSQMKINDLVGLPVETIFSLHYPTEYITLELDDDLTKWLKSALQLTQEHKQLKTFSFGSVTNE